jgi:hypothetical protein
MSLITTFDSGEFTGWAQGRNGRLLAAGLVHVFPHKPMGQLPMAQGGIVTIEKPVHRRNGRTVDPNKMITLGIKVGRLVETYLVLGNEVDVIVPSDWKGGTPKEIQNKRDQGAMTPEEMTIVGPVINAVAESYRNNVWDAIGIFFWTARRQKERT